MSTRLEAQYHCDVLSLDSAYMITFSPTITNVQILDSLFYRKLANLRAKLEARLLCALSSALNNIDCYPVVRVCLSLVYPVLAMPTRQQNITILHSDEKQCFRFKYSCRFRASGAFYLFKGQMLS